MRVYIIIAALFFFNGAAAGELPAFEDFTVAPEEVAHSATLHLDSAKSREYATVLREGARHKVNFAGHYILTTWGCGASCTMSAAINAKTGAVTWLPFTVCCWDLDITEPLEFKANSRLLILHGSRNEKGNGTYFYTFDGTQFRLIKEIEQPAK